MASLCPRQDETTIAEKERMIIDVYQRVEHKFLKHVHDDVDPLYWAAAMIARVIMAKMCLLIYQPMLFPGSEVELSDDIRQRVYVAAIEVIEYNHKLNTDPRCKQYRWLFMTYTNWHAIAYTLMETCRRPWSPLVQRGWEAVNGYERDPVEVARSIDHTAVFVPLRQLFLKARKHRAAQIARLRAHPEEARQLDFAERMNPTQARFGPVPGASNRMEEVRETWRKLVSPAGVDSPNTWTSRDQYASRSALEFQAGDTPSSVFGSLLQTPKDMSNGPTTTRSEADAACDMNLSNATMEYMNDIMLGSQATSLSIPDLWSISPELDPNMSNGPSRPSASFPEQTPMAAQPLSCQQAFQMGTAPAKDDVPPYLWSENFPNANQRLEETDIDMLDNGFDWHDWSQSIRGLELDTSGLGKGGWGMATGI